MSVPLAFLVGARIFGGPAGALLLVPPSRKPRKQNKQKSKKRSKQQGQGMIGFSPPTLFVCILIVSVLAKCSFSFICCLRISGNK